MKIYYLNDEYNGKVHQVVSSTRKDRIEVSFRDYRRSLRIVGYKITDKNLGYFVAEKPTDFGTITKHVYISQS